MSPEAVLAITDTALARIVGFRAGTEAPEEHGLSVRVTGVDAGEYTCALSLERVRRGRDGDVLQHEGDLSVLVAADSVERLRGATIDWSQDPQRTGFVVINPNRPPVPAALPLLPMSMSSGPTAVSPPTPGPGTMDGDVAREVMAVLERVVNPSIAAHGGHAELAGVEGRTAYLRLGGGCQGCGMASVTLTQGIEVAITDAVPEIVDVVDVTDHSSGANPYFEAAKK